MPANPNAARSARAAPRSSRIDDASLLRLAQRVATTLGHAGGRLATAESCTGGWIAKVLTDVAGSSAWFVEGFVTYDNAAKVRTLGVSERKLTVHGAVSEAVVRDMASGALRRADARWSVAVTGIAGPGGAVPGKPVGTVWLAWAVRDDRGRGSRVIARLEHFRGDREAVRRKTVRSALHGLLAL